MGRRAQDDYAKKDSERLDHEIGDFVQKHGHYWGIRKLLDPLDREGFDLRINVFEDVARNLTGLSRKERLDVKTRLGSLGNCARGKVTRASCALHEQWDEIHGTKKCGARHACARCNYIDRQEQIERIERILRAHDDTVSGFELQYLVVNDINCARLEPRARTYTQVRAAVGRTRAAIDKVWDGSLRARGGCSYWIAVSADGHVHADVLYFGPRVPSGAADDCHGVNVDVKDVIYFEDATGRKHFVRDKAGQVRAARSILEYVGDQEMLKSARKKLKPHGRHEHSESVDREDESSGNTKKLAPADQLRLLALWTFANHRRHLRGHKGIFHRAPAEDPRKPAAKFDELRERPKCPCCESDEHVSLERMQELDARNERRDRKRQEREKEGLPARRCRSDPGFVHQAGKRDLVVPLPSGGRFAGDVMELAMATTGHEEPLEAVAVVAEYFTMNAPAEIGPWLRARACREAPTPRWLRKLSELRLLEIPAKHEKRRGDRNARAVARGIRRAGRLLDSTGHDAFSLVFVFYLEGHGGVEGRQFVQEEARRILDRMEGRWRRGFAQPRLARTAA